MKATGIVIQFKDTRWINAYCIKPFGRFRYWGNYTIKDLWKIRKKLTFRFLFFEETQQPPQFRLKRWLARRPYFIVGVTKHLGHKKFVWWNYYKCDQFIIICLLGIYLRICPSKEIYKNLPQAG